MFVMKARPKLDSTTATKIKALVEAMASKGGLVVAFSGGVDSTVAARLAHEALGKRAVAVTADSEVVPRSEIKEAKTLARLIGIEHIIVRQRELEDEKVASNPKDRCYYCRKDLTKILKDIARRKGFKTIADGVNYSDLGEHRPGIKAADEAHIWHPFIDFKVTKTDIRAMARSLGLPVHNKPAAACLSSRIPYGQRITREKLGQVEKAEELLKRMGFGHVRVRHHGEIARIEVPPEHFKRFQDPRLRKRVTKALRKLGFGFVALDLLGYRAGSMDETLSK
jgi:uncharacterized protein